MDKYIKQDHETAKEFAYRVIRQEITSTELIPGALISETDLANFLNISRTPVREALMMLKTEHLIEVKPQLGSFVTLIDWTLIEEALFMRTSLEKSALKEAIQSFDSKALFELERNLLTQELLISQNHDEIDFHTLDQDFHKLIFQGIGKEKVWESIYNISTHYNRVRVLVERKSNKAHLVSQHKEYVDIIKSKKGDAIDELVERHIVEPTKKWPQFIEEHEFIKEYLKER